MCEADIVVANGASSGSAGGGASSGSAGGGASSGSAGGGASSGSAGGSIYHERQSLKLCALHTLNNLLQAKVFTKQRLDEICTNLSPDAWINPHRNILGLGDYDINIIISALQTTGYETIWFDRRKNLRTLCAANVFGFIVNIPYKMHLGMLPLPITSKHWIAIRQIQQTYYNLDSKLASPAAIGDDSDLVSHLESVMRNDDVQLMLVISEETAKNGAWQNRTKETNGDLPS